MERPAVPKKPTAGLEQTSPFRMGVNAAPYLPEYRWSIDDTAVRIELA